MARAMNRPRKAQSLSDLLRPALADALKAQGFAAADILRHWQAIAGPRLAPHSLPVRILFPPRPKGAPPDATPEPATLVLKVETAFALEAEMEAAMILERVNAVFGWRCVGRLRLRQGPVGGPAERKAEPAAPLAPDQEASLVRRVANVEDEALRQALERLGRAVIARRPVTRA
jgi:hypothetical protein